ncbi:MAG: WcaI family glycosyltransferase [Bacteroidia bacterium]|nr:WcaI family glycosyltransferase [Bacteroidia bacterium]
MKNANTQRILILGINFAPELTGIGKYTGEMAAWLARNGYQVTVITTCPYYPNWKIQAPYKNIWYKKEISENGNLNVLRCPMYVPAKPSGAKRIIHEATFFVSASFMLLSQLFKKKNDQIICIAPPFHLGFLALFYRFFKGGKINYHIQDMHIEAARDLKVVKADGIFKLLFGMERFILKRVDSISSISVGMNRKIEAKTGRSVIMFPNWVDTNKFHPLPNRNDFKSKWSFNPNDKIVLYSGSIGEKQGLDALLDIASNIKNDFANIRFVICGTGPYKVKLEEKVKAINLNNVSFLPLQPMETFNEFLNMADVHLVLQKAEAADLVMPSKLTTILSAGGLSIATALPGTSLYDVINDHDMGILIEPENITSLQSAIVEACQDGHDAKRINARKYAERYLNQDTILSSVFIKK